MVAGDERGDPMKRLITVFSALMFLSLNSATSAAELPQTFVVDHIQSDWAYSDGNGHVRWYVIHAEIATNLQTGEIIASKASGGIGSCTRGATECYLSPMREMRVASYSSDTLMQSTTLTVRWGSRVARLSFAGSSLGAGALPQTLHPCHRNATLVQSASRNVIGTGIVFGQHVSSSHDVDRSSEVIQRTTEIC